MAKVSLAGVEVDLRVGFTPTTHAVDGGSRGVPPAIDGIGLELVFRTGRQRVPSRRSRYTGTSGFSKARSR